MLKNKTQLKFVRKSFFAILYGLMSAIGINVFLSHAHSYSIGVPGIAQLLQAIFANFGISVSISFLMISMNIPLFLFGLKKQLDSVNGALALRGRIEEIVDAYGKAALRAKHCGFNQVLLHAGPDRRGV